MANETLGTIECTECGASADVKQTKRRGGHLYSVCPNCGPDQRTGEAVQSRLWRGTEWRDGVDPYKHRPACVEGGLNPPELTEIEPDDWVDDSVDESVDEPNATPDFKHEAVVCGGIALTIVALLGAVMRGIK